MEYFIVSVLALVIATYLIYIVSNKVFNINLRIKPLFLCACCSLFISIILPQLVIGYAGITGTIVVLVICAILFAYFIVYHSNADEVVGSESNVPIVQLEQAFPVIKEVIPLKATAVNPPASLSANSERYSDEQESPILEYSSDEIEAETWTEILLEQPGSAISQVEYVQEQATKAELKPESAPNLESDLPFQLETEVETQPIKTILPEECEQEQPSKAELKLELAPSLESDLPSQLETKLETKSEHVSQQLETIQTQPLMLTMPLQVNPAVDVDAQSQVDDALPESEPMLTDINALESLDDLLDYAFTLKNALQLTSALKAFQKALSLCKEQDVAPLIIVEIGNILKARGQYDEAVQLFSEGRNLPYLLDNSVLNQQFVEMIAFLRIIKNNLLENQEGFVPYDKIPSDIILKINEEFRDWLTLSCAKPKIGRNIEE